MLTHHLGYSSVLTHRYSAYQLTSSNASLLSLPDHQQQRIATQSNCLSSSYSSQLSLSTRMRAAAAPVAPTSAWQGTPRATWGTKIPALAFRGHLTSTLHVLAYCWRLITCSFLPVCFLRLVSANMRLIVTLYLCDDFFHCVPFFYFVLCL